jgi:5'-nucleotidase (lipoprotein e(P4) family)
MRRLVLLLAIPILACATPRQQCDPGLPLLNATLWMQTSAEYRASAVQTYALARRALDEALAEPSAQPAAIILDLDETALDNSGYAARQLAKGETFTFGDSWTEWVRESASAAVPGAREFLQYARSRGVTAFYITNRMTKHEEATRANLEKLGFPLPAAEDTLLVRGERPEWDTTNKTTRRDFVSSRYRVLLLIGDAMSDFTSDPDAGPALWGTKWFLVPNPIYGSWEAAGVDESLPPCERLRRRVDSLQE